MRELKALAELAVVLSDEEEIQEQEINFTANATEKDFLATEHSLKDYTIAITQHFLDKYDYNVLLVAQKLDVGKSTLYRMIQNQELRIK